MAKTQIRLAIVTHKLELELDFDPWFQATTEVNRERLGAGDAPIVETPDRAEERNRCPIDIHASDDDVRFPPPILPIPNNQAPLEDKRRDGDVQLRHDARHQIVSLAEHPEISEAVHGRLLEVTNRQERVALPARDRGDLVGGRHGQRGAQDEEHVGLLGVGVGALEVRLGKVLAEVDDAVEQGSAADCALAACAVVMCWSLVWGGRAEIWMDGAELVSLGDQAGLRYGGIPRMYSFPQSLQYSRLLFPWSSDIIPCEYQPQMSLTVSFRSRNVGQSLTGKIPLLRCKPSQFWLTRYFSTPRFCNSTSAI